MVGSDILEALSLENTLKTKSQTGGTAPERVTPALAEARKNLIS
jgi:argininosuccinate lyase